MMDMGKLVMTMLLTAGFSLSLAAQNIGDKGLMKARSAGGFLSTVAHTSMGHVTPGKKLMDIPEGTIVEARYAGNGWWIGQPQGASQEGVLSSVESIKKEHADPMLMAGKEYSREIYAVESPALGDVPTAIEKFQATKKVSLMDNLGDVVVDYVHIANPMSDKKTVTQYKYCGTYMPYYISLRYVWNNDKATPIDEVRIYPSYGTDWSTGSAIDTAVGAYINGIRYNK